MDDLFMGDDNEIVDHSSSQMRMVPFPLLCLRNCSLASFLSCSLSFMRSTISCFFSLSLSRSPCTSTSRSMSDCFCTRASFIRFSQKRSSLLALISAILFMACTVWTQRSLLYCTGSLRFFSNSKTLFLVIYLLLSFLAALVHANFLGLCFALKCLWHLGRQNLKFLQSFRMKRTPWPGQIGPEQKQHLYILIQQSIIYLRQYLYAI